MAQSFWFVEFKKIVILRHNNVDYEEIKRRCIDENLFGAINPTREKRMQEIHYIANSGLILTERS